ncbi:MAG: hypothetical protein E6356_13400 [Terrisporobacter othiniensis]|uniref:Uncharacterized protein n=2 Tax=Terrisporobacter TaxID=1505652 RepID=A0ABZ2EQN3_9FIRM|nr:MULTISPECIES: hypothetical protein [Terrisporobacter]MBN9647976.1 hypothetical protein [Terrisporobacter glycolicus]MDU4862190.1 hypothetical protein [Terrisporobacter othiniensis]MDU6995850.1 hypothetical protein [Terrisporobacter othiniensis]SFJ53033.1 hypothetical protein SAMN02910355_3000 [Terrisporobacter glycolicus]
MKLGINFTIVGAVMLFVILITIQITLNRIYVVLKEIKSLLNIKKIKD